MNLNYLQKGMTKMLDWMQSVSLGTDVCTDMDIKVICNTIGLLITKRLQKSNITGLPRDEFRCELGKYPYQRGHIKGESSFPS